MSAFDGSVSTEAFDNFLKLIDTLVEKPETQMQGVCLIALLEKQVIESMNANYERYIRRINRRWWVAYMERREADSRLWQGVGDKKMRRYTREGGSNWGHG